LQCYPATLDKEPDTILPAFKDSISIHNNDYRLSVDGVNYLAIYKPGQEERRAYSSRWDDEIVTTPITLTLFVDRQLVFEFRMKKSVEPGFDAPIFREYMGDVTAFIDSLRVEGFESLVQSLEQHRRDVRAQKIAPRRRQQLQADMKRFGI
jgi:hypothetical protein